MKKGFIFILITVTLLMSTFLQAEEKGGVIPCVVSWFVGPRVGLEMNEGKDIEMLEILGVVIPIVRAVPGFQSAGVTGGIIGCCLGPRIGAQYNERNVRTMEWLQLCLIGRFMIPFEAFQGKTMTEIEVEEGLRK